MNIALKKARETIYWLRLLRDSEIIEDTVIDETIQESMNLKNILSAIVKTSRERRGKKLKVSS